jgi:hypothetical protein
LCVAVFATHARRFDLGWKSVGKHSYHSVLYLAFVVGDSLFRFLGQHVVILLFGFRAVVRRRMDFDFYILQIKEI